MISRTRYARPAPSPSTAASGQPPIIDGLYADPCWPHSTGNTRCVLCGKAIANKHPARATHARVHVSAGEVCTHRDALGRTVWFPQNTPPA